MDRDRDQDRDRFEPLDALDARLNPDGRNLRHLAEHAETIPAARRLRPLREGCSIGFLEARHLTR